MSSNPFGVTLRKSTSRDITPPKTPNDFNAANTANPTVKSAIDLSSRRQKLRHVTPAKPKIKRIDSTAKKWLRRVTGSPFTIREAPIFGIVLKPVYYKEKVKDNSAKMELEEATLPRIGEDEPFLDLEFRNDRGKENFDLENTVPSGADKSADDSSGTPFDHSTPSFPFGVRLKPVKKRHHANETPDRSHTYQIDLNPAAGRPGGTYQPAVPISKNFLEIKLKPVKRVPRNNGDEEDDTPEFAELQLRHVLAPADGGPQRTVTEATFQIPLPKLRQVPIDQLTRPGDGHIKKYDPLEELLQMTIESLNPTTPQKRDIVSEHNIRFHLRHVNPHSKEVTTLSHSIDVVLKNTPRSTCGAERKAPSMQVNLKPTPRGEPRVIEEFKPEFADIQLKHVKVMEEEEKEEENSEEVMLEVEGEEEDLEELMQDGSEEEECSSLPDLHLDQLNMGLSDDSEWDNERQINAIKNAEPEKIVETPKEEPTKPEEPRKEEEKVSPDDGETVEDMEDEDKEEKRDERKSRKSRTKTNDSADKGAKEVTCTRARVRRQRSSSLSDVDRMRIRRDQYITLKEKEAREGGPKKELTNKQGRDLLMWYNRMKTPKKEDMKRRVAQLPSSCDITPDDVELLPWLCKGRFLDIKKMNQYFLNDWQGKDEIKKDKDGDSV